MPNKSPTLFYSWQSNNSKTRSYVEGALKKALENVANKMNIEDAPRFDKDTMGEIGAVSITSTIRRKINQSKIFVADVSLVDKSVSGEKLTNQNVMFELGYAFGKKTEKAVMLIANTDLGLITELPFDIAQNRVIPCSPKNDPKKEKFIAALESAIRAHLGFIEEEEAVGEQLDQKEQLIAAIEDNKPTTTKSESFFEPIFSKYLEIAPERYQGGDKDEYGEKVLDSYQKTLPITLEFFDVINIAAEYGDSTTVLTAYRMIGKLAAMYDHQPGETNKYNTSDEYYSLVIQEVSSIIIGLLAKYDRWEIIGDLIPRELKKPKNGHKKYTIGQTYHLPECANQYFKKKTGINYATPTTPMIQERFVDKDEPLKAYASGVLILMFALDWYYPFLAGIFLGDDDTYVPEYFSELKFKNFAEKFKIAVAAKDLQELRELLDEKMKQTLSSGFSHWNNNLTHIFESNDLLPTDKIGSK